MFAGVVGLLFRIKTLVEFILRSMSEETGVVGSGGLGLHEAVANVSAEILDPAAALALAREIPESADGGGRAEIDDETMRMRRGFLFPLAVPEIGGLAVDGILGRAVLACAFFAADMDDAPIRAVQGFAILAEQIQLGDGGEALAIVSIQRFQTEEPPLAGVANFTT